MTIALVWHCHVAEQTINPSPAQTSGHTLCHLSHQCSIGDMSFDMKYGNNQRRNGANNAANMYTKLKSRLHTQMSSSSQSSACCVQ